MIVRSACVADVAAVAEVHVAAWRETYPEILPSALSTGYSVEQRAGLWEAALRRDGVTLLVGEDQRGAIIGFGAAGPARGELPPFEAQISALYVLRRAQGAGLGRVLLGRLAGSQLEVGRRGAFLWVFRDNWRARRFYERLGGELVGERRERFGEVSCIEVAYGWGDLARLAGVVDQKERP